MRALEWYFDFVSPFSYLQCEQLRLLPDDVAVVYKPILFAALLNHWNHKGPAEIPEKRRFTYRSLVWFARKHQIPFRFPRAHPFNPLPLLRLCIALGNAPHTVNDLFRYVWHDGNLPEDPDKWNALMDQLGIQDADILIHSDTVKQALRENTDRAIELGLFGVPTSVIDGQIFWGTDFHEFLLDYLKNPSLFDDPEMNRVSDLPASSIRKAKD